MVGDGFGEKSLSGSWDSVENDSLWRSDTHLLVEFWVGERELDGFLREGERREEEREESQWVREEEDWAWKGRSRWW